MPISAVLADANWDGWGAVETMLEGLVVIPDLELSPIVVFMKLFASEDYCQALSR